MTAPFLSIVIPAYNEEDRLVPTLQQTLAYLKRCSYQSEVIVVSDGSTDHTTQVVERVTAAENVQVNLLSYSPNRGKGYAVKYGMLRAQGDVCMFMDADYAVPIDYCEKGLSLIHQGKDIAIASRAIHGSKIKMHQNFARQLSAKIYTLIQNQYLGIHYPDTQCGFKLFTREATRNLFQQQQLNSVIFDPEILWLARKEGYAVCEFPVQWTHIEGSRIQYDSIGKSIFVFRELLRIKQIHKKSAY